MRRNRLRPGDDALSPVIGAVLLVGIAVLLMAVVGAYVLGFGFAGQPPEGEVQFTQTENTDTAVGGDWNVTVSVVDGSGLREEELRVRVDGQRACEASSQAWGGSGSLRTGNETTVDGYGSSCTSATTLSSGDTVSVIWRPDGSGESHLLGEYEVV